MSIIAALGVILILSGVAFGVWRFARLPESNRRASQLRRAAHDYYILIGTLAVIIGFVSAGVGVFGDNRSDNGNSVTELTGTPHGSATSSMSATPRGTSAPSPMKATATPQPTPTPSPTAVPPETVVYEANWSAGLNGWPSTFGWKVVNSMYVNDGSNDDYRNWVPAPVELGQITNYSIRAEMQFVDSLDAQCDSVGIIARTGYGGGVRRSYNPFYCDYRTGAVVRVLGERPFLEQEITTDNAWHVYELTVRNNVLSLSIDGAMTLEGQDNHYLEGGRIGLWAAKGQANVRSFRVTAK